VIELRISESAALSTLEQADYYRAALDDALAERWESAVDAAIRSLLQFPERGAPCRFSAPELAALRWIFVPGFPKHMIFYRYDRQEAVLLIVQVLHGVRDLESLLGNDPEQEQP
jgi:plasmid stabilization system protein ParE